MPRRVTVYLEAPPGDGLRVAQDHFAEYVKPVLASSGLDWDFVVGRREGDVRAVVAERVRRARRAAEGETAPADEDAAQAVRRRNGIVEYAGVKGDIVVGRHTWKEYVRGLHEGWLGPLAPPPEPESTAEQQPTAEAEAEADKPKSTPPPQPRPYITTAQYPASHPPRLVPAEFDPSATIPMPHILGFLSTPTRMRRFFSRRFLADAIGRDVAAACLCTYREFRDDSSGDGCEQQGALAREEQDWVKDVRKDDEKKPVADDGKEKAAEAPREKIWASPMVLDPRIAVRMRRFELRADDEARAQALVVPEDQVEGWTKGQLRQLGRWAAKKWAPDEKRVNLGSLDDVD